MPTQLQIDILATAHNSVVITGATGRSEKWRIDLDPVEKPFYGYGYGYAFRNLADIDTDPAYDYFNVIGIVGLSEGFGITESKNNGELPDYLEDLDYSYSFGYEYGAAILSNGTDSITIKATVYENDVVQPDIRVLFKGSPGIVITPTTDVTDALGNVYVEVSLDSEVTQNTRRIPGAYSPSVIPHNGIITISAEIDKNPQENEGFVTIRTQAVQLTESSVDVLNLSIYSFGGRYDSCYGFEDYGYWPF